MKKLKKQLVKYIYADHNKSRSVKKTLAKLLYRNERKSMLNIGSGETKIHPNIINFDIQDVPNVDIIGTADNIPFSDSRIDLVISQKVNAKGSSLQVSNYQSKVKTINLDHYCLENRLDPDFIKIDDEGHEYNVLKGLAGQVKVGSHSWIDIGASVIQQINIGSDVKVGTGSVVVSDLQDKITAFGSPQDLCKKIDLLVLDFLD